MKTSLVVLRGPGRFKRAHLPGEVELAEPGVTARFTTAKFSPAYTWTGEVSSFDLGTGRIGPRKKRTEKYPDAVIVPGTARFPFVHGVVDEVREIPEEYVGWLDQIDEGIEKLERARRETIEEAFRRGRPVTKKDVLSGAEPVPAAAEVKAGE
jgi:hypothetical protein